MNIRMATLQLHMMYARKYRQTDSMRAFVEAATKRLLSRNDGRDQRSLAGMEDGLAGWLSAAGEGRADFHGDKRPQKEREACRMTVGPF